MNGIMGNCIGRIMREPAGFDQANIDCKPFPLLDETMSWLLAAAEKTVSDEMS